MIGVSLGRVTKAAFQNFWRNIWLSIATLVIMTITLLTLLLLYFANVFGAEVLRTIEQKVDLSATFKESVTEGQIRAIAEEIGSREDVEEVRVVTSDQALEEFRARHADDPFIEDSLRELENNPLPASMFVVASEPRFYQNIATHLESDKYGPFIEKVNFQDLRPVIQRLIDLMTTVRNGAVIATLVFAALAVLVMFNTVRLAIYSFREEIDIMRLVGASNWFIRGPFVLEAVLVALLAVAIATAIIYPVVRAVSPRLDDFFFTQSTPFNLYQYAVDNWLTVIGLQAAVAVGLAIFSSMIAIRRYLRRR
jgi:cell division transport system permease protein